MVLPYRLMSRDVSEVLRSNGITYVSSLVYLYFSFMLDVLYDVHLLIFLFDTLKSTLDIFFPRKKSTNNTSD